MQNNTSKINTVLLVILIVLVGYFAFFKNKAVAPTTPDTNQPTTSDILGNKEDLISFSILPNSKVRGVVSYSGEIKGGYFFEANVGINVLDKNQKVLKRSYAMATTDWMTGDGVKFDGKMDFTGLPVGPAYFEIRQDDPSGGESGRPIRYVQIPIVIE